MNTPLFNRLVQLNKSNPLPFHMPGHKLGKGLPHDFKDKMSEIDVTEINGTDNLHFPEDVILEAQKLAAKAFGAKHTFFLVNGSTVGVLAMIIGSFKKGDKILVERNCHKSVINACIIGGIEPVFILPEIDSVFGITLGLTAKDVKHAIISNSDIQGIILTRPNYYGICSDLEEIINEAKKKSIIVLVDEAHGAHFCFNKKLPASALKLGADAVVQSAHKTLPALTQSAYLHIGTLQHIEKIKWVLRSIQTSSPSYILMASLDIAREIMQKNGKDMFDRLLNNITDFEGQLDVLGIKYFKSTASGFVKDDTRIVINVLEYGYTGYEIDNILSREYNINVEMSDYSNIVLIPSLSHDKNDFNKLIKAFKNIKPKDAKKNKITIFNHIPECEIKISDALTKEYSYIKIKDAMGRTSADMIIPYPPGVPLVYPGEVMDKEVCEYLNKIISQGANVQGVNNGTVKIID